MGSQENIPKLSQLTRKAMGPSEESQSVYFELIKEPHMLRLKAMSEVVYWNNTYTIISLIDIVIVPKTIYLLMGFW
jgi:hypothetical protein